MKKGLLAAALLAGCSPSGPPADRPILHLLTATSVFWGEGDIAALVQGKAARPPLMQHLEADWQVVPLDIARPEQLKSISLLLIIQPPALAPDELVALDAWVRAGGHVLILADPDLQHASAGGRSDAQQPPRTTLLLPLLAHWGLRLVPDPPEAPPRQIHYADVTIAAPGSGQWQRTSQECAVLAAAIARCTLGKGVALIVADADVALWASDSTAQAAGQDLIDQLLNDLRPKRRTNSE